MTDSLYSSWMRNRLYTKRGMGKRDMRMRKSYPPMKLSWNYMGTPQAHKSVCVVALCFDFFWCGLVRLTRPCSVLQAIRSLFMVTMDVSSLRPHVEFFQKG
jgi:hypothetical protein